MIPYFASKFGVESITEGMQDELAEFGIENVSIQPGVYPIEMNNGSKAGVHADKQEIVDAYGAPSAEKFKAMGTALFSKMEAFTMDPQTIADGVLYLVQMKAGSRSMRKFFALNDRFMLHSIRQLKPIICDMPFSLLI